MVEGGHLQHLISSLMCRSGISRDMAGGWGGWSFLSTFLALHGARQKRRHPLKTKYKQRIPQRRPNPNPAVFEWMLMTLNDSDLSSLMLSVTTTSDDLLLAIIYNKFTLYFHSGSSPIFKGLLASQTPNHFKLK